MKKCLFVSLFFVLMATSVFAMAAPEGAYGYRAPNPILSFLPFIIIVIIAAIIIPLFGRGGNRGGTALVLKEFKLNENEDEFLKIVGRASGFIGWLLSIFGIDPITSLTCNKKSIKFEVAAIKNGKNTLNVPLASISGVQSGINKPFILLVFGIIFIFGGIFGAIASRSFGMFFIGVIIGVVCIVFYSLKKTMSFGIYCGGDRAVATICMKKSIIEGQSIDEAKYELAANALLQVVLESKK